MVWKQVPKIDSTDDLIALAQDKSSEGREALVATMADLFLEEGEVLSEKERAIMTDILRALILDVELTVRKQLAERLSTAGNVPNTLLTELANDEIEVAHPILLRSEVLKNAELIEIIRHRTMEHRLTIAMRESVAPEVTDALVEQGEGQVIERLLENPGAQISTGAMETIVELSETNERLHMPLIGRDDLAPDLAKRMLWWVSAALRKHIVTAFEIDPTTLDNEMERTVRALLNGEEGVSDIDPKVAEEYDVKHKQVDPEDLLRFLRRGEVSIFETMLAKKLGLRLELLRRLLFEPGGEGLAIACRAVEIPPKIFAAMYRLTREAKEKTKETEVGELTRATSFYLAIDADMAREVLTKWRRDPDYLWAIKQLSRVAERTAEAMPAEQVH